MNNLKLSKKKIKKEVVKKNLKEFKELNSSEITNIHPSHESTLSFGKAYLENNSTESEACEQIPSENEENLVMKNKSENKTSDISETSEILETNNEKIKYSIFIRIQLVCSYTA